MTEPTTTRSINGGSNPAGPYRTRYGRTESLSCAVVLAVARAAGVKPTEIEPLYDVVDPDALDTLFKRRRHNDTHHGRITFSLHGYNVTVYNSGEIIIDGTDFA